MVSCAPSEPLSFHSETTSKPYQPSKPDNPFAVDRPQELTSVPKVPVENSAVAVAPIDEPEIKRVLRETQESQEHIDVKDAYRVGPDDELKIAVYGEKELSGTYAVNGTGKISMPLIGDIEVQNLTLKQIENSVVTKLDGDYILDPRVSVEITKYRPFYILGEVRTPGSYPYVNNMSIMNAVAVAGGFTYRANKKRADVMRMGENNEEVRSTLEVQDSVLPGDIILIKERFF